MPSTSGATGATTVTSVSRPPIASQPTASQTAPQHGAFANVLQHQTTSTAASAEPAGHTEARSQPRKRDKETPTPAAIPGTIAPATPPPSVQALPTPSTASPTLQQTGTADTGTAFPTIAAAPTSPADDTPGTSDTPDEAAATSEAPTNSTAQPPLTPASPKQTPVPSPNLELTPSVALESMLPKPASTQIDTNSPAEAQPQPAFTSTHLASTDRTPTGIPAHDLKSKPPVATSSTLEAPQRDIPTTTSASGNSQSHHESKGDARSGNKDTSAQNDAPSATASPQPSALPPPPVSQALPQVALTVPATQTPAQNAPGATDRTPDAGLSPAPTSQATAAADPSPLSAIAAARLIRTAAGSELRVGTRSEEFGAITIHTVLGREQLSAHISLEDQHLGSALSTHLSSLQETLQQRLGESLGIRAAVSLSAGTSTDSGADARGNSGDSPATGTANSGTRQNANPNQQGSSPEFSSSSPGSLYQTAARSLAYTTQAAAQGRLDIRI